MSWFSFETPKERKKRERKYFNKVYPYGEEQRNWERQLLSELAADEDGTSMLVFELLILKEALLNNSLEDDEDRQDELSIISNWQKNALKKKYSPAVLGKLERLAKAQLISASLDELKKLYYI